MRVVINAASAHMGGAVTYLQNLLRWLPIVAPSDQFTLYAPPATREKLARLAAGNVDLQVYPHADTGGLARFVFDQIELPRLLRRQGADVLFSSTGFGTFFSPRPQVLLVRNLAYFDPAFQQRYRELGRSLRRNTMRRWMSYASMAGADTILFPTRAMQEMVMGSWRPRGKRVMALSYGFEHKAIQDSQAADAHWPEQVARFRAEGFRVLLNVSTFAVQKNLETLVAALPHLRAQGMKVKLLTTTSREDTTDKAEYDALVRTAEALGVREDWVELGYVSYQQLAALYRLADAYVFPSCTESFGHSLVEAMASGVPVVASDTPVNQEVCGDAARYFRTFDPQDCAQAIAAVLTDRELTASLLEASGRQAARFSWRQHVEQLVHLFREMSGR